MEPSRTDAVYADSLPKVSEFGGPGIDLQSMQLDLFEHSRDVMLHNDMLAALERRDPNAARAAWHTLGTEFADNASLPALDALVCALERRTSAPFADHEAAREARFAL